MATRVYPDTSIQYFDGIQEVTRFSMYLGFGKYRVFDSYSDDEIFPVLDCGMIYLNYDSVVHLMDSVKQ